MFGLIWLALRITFWMMGAALDLMFLLLTLGQIDTKIRKMF
ncbi:hypothetical protein [Streptomyces sp. NPDC047990]